MLIVLLFTDTDGDQVRSYRIDVGQLKTKSMKNIETKVDLLEVEILSSDPQENNVPYPNIFSMDSENKLPLNRA